MSESTNTSSVVDLKSGVNEILSFIEQEREREIITRRFGLYDRRETLEQIGELVGGRDHSTVIHACEKIRNESAVDEPLKQELILIKERVYNSFDK